MADSPHESGAAARAPAAWRAYIAGGRGRWLGLAVAIVLAGVMLLPDPGPVPGLRLWAFDSYQHWLPRQRASAPAIVIAIDDQSLARIGQWPWSRDIVARLIDRVSARKPAAIGLDVLFAEPDRSSPERIAENLASRDPVVAERLRKLRSNDEILAESVRKAGAVLGVAGIEEIISPESRAGHSDASPASIPRYVRWLRSLEAIDGAAAGHGLLNADPERGIVRRVPLVARVNENSLITLGLETLRAAAGVPAANLVTREGALTHVVLGDLRVPSHADGKAWIYFSRRDAARFISAATVLEGKDDPALLEGRIALVGVTALALLDQHTTAIGERMPGIEIHAQLLENIFERKLLYRPAWGRYAEALLFALAAGLIVLRVPRTRPRNSALLFLACVALMLALSTGAFALTQTLLDPILPIAGLTLLYGLMLSATLVAIDLQRRQLSLRLAAERESAARVTGELEAARRIQLGILPTRESALKNERRIEIFAYMKAAREVGGDLYDFFPLSEDKFIVLVGDVSDKGLPAAMFMAVSKAVAKSCALRAPAGAAELMNLFNREIPRENPEQLFVTLILLLIDLRTGEFEYCNAGHEPPLLVRRSGEVLVLDEGGGPPLCVLEEFEYEAGRASLAPRDVLALVSDGLTEAMDRNQALYGRARLRALLQSPTRRDLDLTMLGSEMLASVRAFEGGSEPADDQTLVLFSWRGA